MRKGQFIRKQLKDGTPIGPYLRITGFIRGTVVAQSLSGKVDYIIPRKDVCELKVIKLIIPDEIVDRVKNGRQSAIIHDVSSRWRQSNLNCAEVVQLRSQKYAHNVVLCSVYNTATVYYNRTPQVRLQLGSIIATGYE